MPIDDIGDAELPGEVDAGRGGAEFAHDGSLWGVPREPTHELGRGAEVLLPDNLRFTVHALALA